MRRAALIVVVLIAGAGAFVGYRAWQRANPGVVDLDSAWQRVRTESRSPGAWAALADAQAAMDQPEAAEQSYRTALRLGGDHPALLGQLGFLLYGQGRDREAYELLHSARERGAELPMLDATVAALAEQLEPTEPPAEAAAALEAPADEPEVDEPEHACTVPVRRAHDLGTFLVDVRVAGEPATLVVDTGASLTALAQAFVIELGAEVDRERTIHAITATGPAVFPTATVDSLEVGGEQVTGLRVAVCDGCGGRDATGLLGLDVSAALGLELDIQGSVLRFVDCR